MMLYLNLISYCEFENVNVNMRRVTLAAKENEIKQGRRVSIVCYYFVVTQCCIANYVILVFTIIFSLQILMSFKNCRLNLGPCQIMMSLDHRKCRFSLFEIAMDGRTS